MFSKVWWKAAAVRAAKTFAQSVVGSGIVVGAISANTDWSSVGWQVGTVFVIGAVSAVLSLLTSIAGLPEVKQNE